MSLNVFVLLLSAYTFAWRVLKIAKNKEGEALFQPTPSHGG